MPFKSARRPGELVFAVVIVAFGLAAFWQAYEISGFTGLTTAGVFPMLAAGTMVVAAFFILVGTARRRAPVVETGSVTVQFFWEVLTLRHATVIALVLLYLLALPIVGFLIASGAFLLLAFQYLWRKNLLITAALTAVSLAAVYLVFSVVFQVVLPQGTLLAGLI